MSLVVLTLPSPLAFEGPIRGGLPTLVGSGDVKEARDKVLIRFDESPKEKKETGRLWRGKRENRLLNCSSIIENVIIIICDCLRS